MMVQKTNKAEVNGAVSCKLIPLCNLAIFDYTKDYFAKDYGVGNSASFVSCLVQILPP